MKRSERKFAVCVRNEGYAAALELLKVYEVLTDNIASKLNKVRVVDESGEDYLYPQAYFVPVRVPESAEKALLRAANADR